MKVKQMAVGAVVVLAVGAAGPIVDLWHHARARAPLYAAPTGAPEPAPTPVESATQTATPSAAATPATPPSTASTAAPTAAATPAGKVVYLTFDDGPDPRWTPQVLALLAKYHAHATFFEIGQEAARHPEQTAAVLAAGHRIGNHTWDHRWLTKLSPAQVGQELTRTDDALGLNTACVRPPGGFVNHAVRGVITGQGKKVELWDGDTRDWSRPGVPHIVRAVMAQLRPGTVVLLHDGGGDRSQSVAALAQVLPAMAAKGYRFEPLPGC